MGLIKEAIPKVYKENKINPVEFSPVHMLNRGGVLVTIPATQLKRYQKLGFTSVDAPAPEKTVEVKHPRIGKLVTIKESLLPSYLNKGFILMEADKKAK